MRFGVREMRWPTRDSGWINVKGVGSRGGEARGGHATTGAIVSSGF